MRRLLSQHSQRLTHTERLPEQDRGYDDTNDRECKRADGRSRGR